MNQSYGEIHFSFKFKADIKIEHETVEMDRKTKRLAATNCSVLTLNCCTLQCL